jgi:hypothetical protein
MIFVPQTMAQKSFTGGPLHTYRFLFSHVSNITMMALQVPEDEYSL